jgi:cytochrome c-type biogenesis protein CcmH/NrfG
VAEAQKKVTEGFAPLLERWKSMTDAHQKEMQRVYGEMGERAAERYKAALKLDPKNAMATYYLALSQLQTGDADGAKASFQHALELDPTLDFARQALAGLGG